jgi:hypothetical protein
MASYIGRRKFLATLGGAAAWPLTARAQQGERVRRIGVLMAHPKSDPEFQTYVTAFQQGLQKLGWTEGRNIQIDSRRGALVAFPESFVPGFPIWAALRAPLACALSVSFTCVPAAKIWGADVRRCPIIPSEHAGAAFV